MLLLPGGALGVLLAWQRKQGRQWQGAAEDRSMATPFSCSQTPPPGAETLPLPASHPCLHGPGAPSPSVQAGCSAGAHRGWCGTVKEGGSGLGCSHGCTLRGLDWAVWGTRLDPRPKGSCMQQGVQGGTSGNSGRQEAVSGLLLGRTDPGGSTLWLQPLPLPSTQGHHTQPAPEPQHPVRAGR